jgi:hypothetical protein
MRTHTISEWPRSCSFMVYLKLLSVAETTHHRKIGRLVKSKCRRKWSVGLDDIPGFIIKGCSSIFIPILRHIFKKSSDVEFILLVTNPPTRHNIVESTRETTDIEMGRVEVLPLQETSYDFKSILNYSDRFLSFQFPSLVPTFPIFKPKFTSLNF